MKRKYLEQLIKPRSPEEEAGYWIQRYKEPATELLRNLRIKIEQLEYDSVLGDDTGARIHTLVFSQAIKEIYGDRKNLQTIFVQGGVPLKDDPEHKQNVINYLEHMKPRLGKKCLIVTEEISSGETVKKLANILNSIGVQADVATFGTAWDQDAYTEYVQSTDQPKIMNLGGLNIFVGEYSLAPSIPKDYLGLWDRSKSGHGHAIKQHPRDLKFMPDSDWPSNWPSSDKISAARVKAKELGHQLAQEFLSSKK